MKRVTLERKVVLALVWESQETHVRHRPPWYDLKPRLRRAIADKSVVFLSKARMEPTKTDFQRMSHIGHLFSTYQNLLGKDELNR